MKQFWIGFSTALALIVLSELAYRLPRCTTTADFALAEYGVLFMAVGICIGIIIPKIKMKVLFGICAAVVGAIMMMQSQPFYEWVFSHGWL